MIHRAAHKSVHALENDIRAWITDWNAHPPPFIWTKTAEEILDSPHDFVSGSPAQDTSWHARG